MAYSLDDFLTFTPVFHKELKRFSLFFAEQVSQGEDPVQVTKDFAANIQGLYGIAEDVTLAALGMEPLGLQGLKDAYHIRTFSSPQLEHDTIKEEARQLRASFDEAGFHYQKNAELFKAFLERDQLLKQYSDVRIAPAFLPMGEAIYVPEYVSLWVKE